MGLPTGDLNSTFWLSAGAIVSALLGVMLKSMYKSKCSEVDLCCIKIKRDIASEVKEDMAEHRKESLDNSTATTPVNRIRRTSI